MRGTSHRFGFDVPEVRVADGNGDTIAIIDIPTVMPNVCGQWFPVAFAFTENDLDSPKENRKPATGVGLSFGLSLGLRFGLRFGLATHCGVGYNVCLFFSTQQADNTCGFFQAYNLRASCTLATILE